MRELAHVRSVAGSNENFCRLRQAHALERQCFPIGAKGNRCIKSVRDDFLRLRAGPHGHCVDGFLRFVFGGEKNRFAVRRPREFIRAAVKAFGEIFPFFALPVVEHHAPTIGFVSGRKLRVISDESSIRRVHGISVKALLRGDALRFASRYRNDEQISVRADRFHPVGNGGEAELLRVRREIDISGAAPFVRWNVVVRSESDVAGRRAFAGWNHKEMSAPVESLVSGCASPPSIESKYSCELPLREERNASVLPSGDHTGEESCPLRVSCISAPPAVGTIQILLAPRFASMSGVVTV